MKQKPYPETVAQLLQLKIVSNIEFRVATNNKIIHICRQLHSSKAWEKANWRAKIKLAKKEFQRQIAKNPSLDLRTFKNSLLFPLRIIVGMSTEIDYILRFNVPNRLGNSLTRLARNKNLYIAAEDFWHAGRIGIPFNHIPFCGLYETEKVDRYLQWKLLERWYQISRLKDKQK